MGNGSGIHDRFTPLSIDREAVPARIGVTVDFGTSDNKALNKAIQLSRGEATVNELAEPFDISLPAVSRHLKVLEGAGLISRGREAQWRPCRLEPAALRSVDDWLERYRALWEGNFKRLDALLEVLQAPASTPRATRRRSSRRSRR